MALGSRIDDYPAIRIWVACDDGIGMWSLRDHFHVLEQELCEARIFLQCVEF